MKTRNTYYRLALALPAAWIAITSIAMAQAPPTGPISQGVFTHDGEAFRVVNTAGFRTAADQPKGDPGAIQQVGLLSNVINRNSCDSIAGACGSCDGCSSGGACMTMGCGSSSCGGSCSTGSCGTGSCGNGSCGCNAGGCNTQYTRFCGFPYGFYDGPLCDPCYDPCDVDYNPCGTVCCPYSYASVDFLLMDRDGDGAAQFDWEPGIRATVGKMPDCGRGLEFTFTGLAEFDSTDVINGGLGRVSGSNIAAGSFDSSFYSFEVSRTLVSQDVAKLLYGFRYIQFDEDFTGAWEKPSADPVSGASIRQGTTGDVDNALIGFQVGGDFYFPVSRRSFVDYRGRGGVYLNLVDRDITALAGPAPTRFNDDDDEIAGVFELGMGLNYRASERLTIRAGAEGWYLAGVSTIQNELRDTFATGLANRVGIDEGVFFYGISLGANLKF